MVKVSCGGPDDLEIPAYLADALAACAALDQPGGVQLERRSAAARGQPGRPSLNAVTHERLADGRRSATGAP
jgi:hypothetical protein